jgi:hypothetical protein
MTYPLIEARLETLVQAFAGSPHTFAAGTNLARGDFRVLDAAGVTVSCVITQWGDSEYADAIGRHREHGKRQALHRPSLGLFWKRGQGSDGAAYAGLRDLTDLLIAYLERYPRLNGLAGVHRAEVVRATAIVALRQPGGGPLPHLARRVQLEVTEEFALNLAPGETIG